MGCDSCGTKSAPGGCKSNGDCGTNSCNRLNAYDWLVNLPIQDTTSYCRVVEISFNNGSRKEFYRNGLLQQLYSGDTVAVEGVSGFDVGEVSLTGETVRLQLKKKGVSETNAEMKRVLRIAVPRDIELLSQNKAREKEAVIRTRAIVRQLRLNMKASEVEFQADGKKATFYYIADDRVDFRELIKVLAGEFKVKVEMRQIGARQEAGKVGGIGSCGRELCCATWLTEFKSVNTAAARYQNLSINQTKLSGQCGRLKCCLNYELDTYLDALQGFPENADMLRVARGNATLIKKDIFKNLMWYVLPDSSKQYPLTIERVQKIRTLNNQNIIPEDLEAVEVTSTKVKEVEPEFVDVVGHISLKSLEKNDRKRRDRARGDQRAGGQGGNQGGGQRRGPQGSGGQQSSTPGGGGQQGGRPPRPQGQRSGQPKTGAPNPGRQPGGQQGGNQGGNQQGGGQQNRPPRPPRTPGNNPQANSGGESGGGNQGNGGGQRRGGGQQRNPNQRPPRRQDGGQGEAPKEG
jgi:cell fate regulator YaaT (PSP1 superfamily)